MTQAGIIYNRLRLLLLAKKVILIQVFHSLFVTSKQAIHGKSQ